MIATFHRHTPALPVAQEDADDARHRSLDPSGQPVALDITGETSPYPFFEYMRRTDPVWHGSLTDQSQMPEEMRPNDEWVLFGYDGLFQAFRDDRSSRRRSTTRPSDW